MRCPECDADNAPAATNCHECDASLKPRSARSATLPVIMGLVSPFGLVIGMVIAGTVSDHAGEVAGMFVFYVVAFAAPAIGCAAGVLAIRRCLIERDRWLALIAPTLGIMMCLGAAVVTWGVFHGLRHYAGGSTCESNVSQLAKATLAYADDNDGRLPPAETWCDAILPYVGMGNENSRKTFVCPLARRRPCGYAFNRALSGVALADIEEPGKVVLIFDARVDWNGSGGRELVDWRHRGSATVGFADGSSPGPRRPDSDYLAGLVWELPPGP